MVDGATVLINIIGDDGALECWKIEMPKGQVQFLISLVQHEATQFATSDFEWVGPTS